MEKKGMKSMQKKKIQKGETLYANTIEGVELICRDCKMVDA